MARSFVAGVVVAVSIWTGQATADIFGLTSVFVSEDTTSESCASFAVYCGFAQDSSGAFVTASGELLDLSDLSAPIDLGVVSFAPRGAVDSNFGFIDLRVTFGQTDGTSVDVYFTGKSQSRRKVAGDVSGSFVFGPPKTFRLDGKTYQLAVSPVTYDVQGTCGFDCTGGSKPTIVLADASDTRERITGSLVDLTLSAPEPSSWTMIFLGFFGLGLFAHLRHSKAPPI